MDSKRKVSNIITLLLSINLIFCALTAHATKGCIPPSNNPNNPNTPPSNNPNNPNTPPSNNPNTPPSNNPNNPNTPPSNNPNTPPSNNPNTPPTNNPNTCPRDALKLGVCANLLGNLLGIVIGNPSVQSCCSLIQGLVDLEAAVCLCTVIRANLLGINLNIPLSLSLLLNVCGRNFPSGFVCN